MNARSWIEATRLRTLPVSISGVIAGCGCAAYYDGFNAVPALICLLFAIIAQIASNFANEYYDYAYGLDKKGRAGFRRGVTEGDISPKSMLAATWTLIAIDSLLGLILLHWGGWWLILPGIAIAVFAIAYSAGPYPLSHHGLGDIAVIIFFGVVPVTLTCYVQTGQWNWHSISIPIGATIGLMAANVLVVNNYRDADDDRVVGKHTTVVLWGRKFMSRVYLYSGIIAVCITFFTLLCQAPAPTSPMPSPTECPIVFAAISFPGLLYLILHFLIWNKLRRFSGSALNPLLGLTACNLLLYALLTTILLVLYP